jgi:prepilin-type N-terminal cleavage/methylation domain-containing protein
LKNIKKQVNLNEGGSMQKKVMGFTLLELIIVMAIAAIIAAWAIPSFFSMIERKRLSGAAETIQAHFQLGKSESVQAGRDIYIVFQGQGTENWCLGMDMPDGSAIDCQCQDAPASCSISTPPRKIILQGSDFKGITLTTVSFGNPDAKPFTVFNAKKATAVESESGVSQLGVSMSSNGTERSGSITLTAGQKSMTVKVSLLGTVTICGTKMIGYSSC